MAVPFTCSFNGLDTLVFGTRGNHLQERRLKICGGRSPLMTQHCAMPQRNLLLYGITRGKRLVVLVCRRKAVASLCATSQAGGAGRNYMDG